MTFAAATVAWAMGLPATGTAVPPPPPLPPLLPLLDPGSLRSTHCRSARNTMLGANMSAGEPTMWNTCVKVKRFLESSMFLVQ